MPNGRCRMHGGKTPRGKALPQTTHGRYSRDLPTRLGARYLEAQADPDLLNLTHEIALTDTFIADALSGLESGESGALWADLQVQWTAYQEARAAGDSYAEATASLAISDLIKRGSAPYQIRAETMHLAETRRRLVESEGKRRVQMQQMISAEHAMLLVTALVDVVVRHVPDERTRAAISADIGALVARGDQGAA